MDQALPRLQRLKRKADFELALGRGAAGVLAKSPHFVVHFSPVLAPPQGRLSTGTRPQGSLPVDDTPSGLSLPSPATVRVGTVLPKRFARRAVTRNLLDRQIHAAAARALPQLSGGAWVLRLRGPIDRAEFRSAASDALRHAARAELDALLAQAARRLAARGASSRTGAKAGASLPAGPDPLPAAPAAG